MTDGELEAAVRLRDEVTALREERRRIHGWETSMRERSPVRRVGVAFIASGQNETKLELTDDEALKVMEVISASRKATVEAKSSEFANLGCTVG